MKIMDAARAMLRMGTAPPAAQESTPPAHDARAAYLDWHRRWREREREIQQRTGNPAWRARSRIALDLEPCPPLPDGVRLDLAALAAGVPQFTPDGDLITINGPKERSP